MPQLKTIVLKSGPPGAKVPHNYVPRGISGGVATLVESTGIPLGDRKITMSSSVTPTGKRKLTLKLQLPVVQTATVGGATNSTVVRTAYGEVSVSFDPTSDEIERGDMWGFLSQLCDPFGFHTYAGNGEDWRPFLVGLEGVY